MSNRGTNSMGTTMGAPIIDHLSGIRIGSSMMTEQLKEKYRAYARCIRRILLFGGILPGGKDQSIAYRQIPIFVILTGVLIDCSLVNSCLKNVNNLARFTKSLGLFVSFFTVIYKTVIFRIYREELFRLNESLEELFEDALREPRLESALLSHIRYFYRPVHFYVFSTTTALTMYQVKPISTLIHSLVKGIPLKYNILPYDGVYPWKLEGNLALYQFHLFHELQFAWFILCITCGVDSAFGFYMFQMSGLLRVMGYEIENLDEQDDRKEVLKKCVERHRRLIECRDIIQKVYGPIVTFMTLTNALILCTAIFQAFQADGMTVDRAILFGFYVFMKFAQTFMYAWYGEYLTTENEDFQRAVYFSGWDKYGDREFGKNILLVLAQKPIILTAYNFITISLDIFVGISNTTISYFFLLRTLEESG